MAKSLTSPLLRGSPLSIPKPGPRTFSVATELVTFENRAGKRIVGFHDFPQDDGLDKRWVIVLPGFGETKTDVLGIAYFLAKNGFHTLRFDYSDHVGESDGEILFTTLTKMKDDILSSLSYLYRRFQPSAVGALASSLACRPLLRAAREDDRIALVMNLVSVVDLRKTIFSILREDYFAYARQGPLERAVEILGFAIDADHFLHSAIRDGFEDLATTLDDVRLIKSPLVFFAAERDAWVDLDDVRRVFDRAASQQKDLYILKDAMHRLYENPEVAKESLKRLVEYAWWGLSGDGVGSIFSEPNLREIGRRIKKEKERNRVLHEVTKGEEREFWKGFLKKYSFALDVHEYWNLLDFINRLLGQTSQGEKILDVGCGTGNYANFLLLKLMYQERQSLAPTHEGPVFSYVGVDFVKEAISEAVEMQEHIWKQVGLGGDISSVAPPADFQYVMSDLEAGLPFEEGSFGKICCNMVISYLQDPRRALVEMLRVLKPGGRIVVTSLKPFPDLSGLYRDYVESVSSYEKVSIARDLFNSIARVKLKETEGIYSFFSEEELTDILKDVGAHDVETYRSFGNQVNVAVAVKR